MHVKISIDPALESLMILFDVLFGLLNGRGLPVPEELHQVNTAIVVLKYIEFDPSAEVSRPALDSSLQVVSVVLSPADNC